MNCPMCSSQFRFRVCLEIIDDQLLCAVEWMNANLKGYGIFPQTAVSRFGLCQSCERKLSIASARLVDTFTMRN